MKKQIRKGAWAVSLVGALALLALPAQAAEISAKIPFSFDVNGRTLPPGTYQVTTQIGHVLLMRGLRDSAFVTVIRMESAQTSDPKLVFHRYGARYVLRQAWLGGGRGRELPESRLERELARGDRTGKLAQTLERVVIAGY